MSLSNLGLLATLLLWPLPGCKKLFNKITEVQVWVSEKGSEVKVEGATVALLEEANCIKKKNKGRFLLYEYNNEHDLIG